MSIIAVSVGVRSEVDGRGKQGYGYSQRAAMFREETAMMFAITVMISGRAMWRYRSFLCYTNRLAMQIVMAVK
jgi:hypothetical protein